VTAVSDDEVLNLETELRAFLFFAGHCSLVCRHRRPGWIPPAGVFFCSESGREWRLSWSGNSNELGVGGPTVGPTLTLRRWTN